MLLICPDPESSPSLNKNPLLNWLNIHLQSNQGSSQLCFSKSSPIFFCPIFEDFPTFSVFWLKFSFFQDFTKERTKSGKVGQHWSSSLDRQLLNSILASRHKSSAHIFYTLDIIAQANDLHQFYILNTYSACESNEDNQCGPTFPLFMLPLQFKYSVVVKLVLSCLFRYTRSAF